MVRKIEKLIVDSSILVVNDMDFFWIMEQIVQKQVIVT
jgi:hypothetical protein